MGIEARQRRRASRKAECVHGEGVRELNPLASDAIEVRRMNDGIPIEAVCFRPMSPAKQENEVGPRQFRARRSRYLKWPEPMLITVIIPAAAFRNDRRDALSSLCSICLSPWNPVLIRHRCAPTDVYRISRRVHDNRARGAPLMNTHPPTLSRCITSTRHP